MTRLTATPRVATTRAHVPSFPLSPLCASLLAGLALAPLGATAQNQTPEAPTLQSVQVVDSVPTPNGRIQLDAPVETGSRLGLTPRETPASVTVVDRTTIEARGAQDTQEILRAIEKGNEYLKSKQNPEGYWAQPSYPALTALAVTAYMRDPANQGKPVPEYIRKGYDFILKSQKEDGSIFNRGMSSYNTAVCMMALLAANKEEYAPAILKGRA